MLFRVLRLWLNGKSTFINTIRELMGSYAKQVEVSTFMETNRNDGLRNDLAALAGRRFVVSPEGKQGAAWTRPW
ncbi:hypothetical protein J4714_13995 [Staphylococcus epidermidis]|nr:hypothetical protein [Staphylococcus epidermidis]